MDMGMNMGMDMGMDMDRDRDMVTDGKARIVRHMISR